MTRTPRALRDTSLVGLVALIALVCVTRSASAQEVFVHHVYGTCADGACGLFERPVPAYTNEPSLGLLHDGNEVDIVCQTTGERVTPNHGIGSDVWDELTNSHYVTDVYIDTSGVGGAFSPPIPRCPPAASISSPASEGTYVQGSTISTSFGCVEAVGGDGLQSCTDSNGGSGSSGVLNTSALGPQNYTVTARSLDGATGTAEIRYMVAAPPSAVIGTPVSGETYPQGAVVSTSFTCTDGEHGTGIESCTDANGAAGGSGTLDTAIVGPQVYVVTAKSHDGGIGTASISYTVAAVKATCSGNSGKVTYAPGITNTPAVQAVKIAGSLTGCSGGGFTEAKYTAKLNTSSPVSCSTLTGSGQPAAGKLSISWRPKAKGGRSIGSLSLAVTEAPNTSLGGTLSSGAFAPATLTGMASQTYTGATTCGILVKGKVKPVKAATLAGSTIQLY